MVATSLKPGTQNMVSSQLLPLHFDPHGLATPISVIVNLLVHCFLLNREIEEVKGHAAEVTEDVRVLKELYEGVSCNLIACPPHTHTHAHTTHTHTHRWYMLINNGLWIMTNYWNKLLALNSLRHLVVIAMSLCHLVVRNASSASWADRTEWAVVWGVGSVRL